MKWRVGDSFQKACIESFSSIFLSISHNSQNEVLKTLGMVLRCFFSQLKENGISRIFAFLCPRTQPIIEFGYWRFQNFSQVQYTLFSVACGIGMLGNVLACCINYHDVFCDVPFASNFERLVTYIIKQKVFKAF